jgi:monoamine oxidase
MKRRKSALIVGGGISGLAAALELARNKISVRLIEAKDRFGGRIHTIHSGPVPVELGAEFVHGQSPPLLRAIRDAKLKTQPVPDKHRLFKNGRFAELNLWDIVGKTINRIDIRQPDDTFEQFLTRQKIKEPARTLTRNFVMGFDAADPNRASAHALRRAEYSAEQMHMETQSRIIKGYSALVEYFIRQIKHYGGHLISGTSARRIGWKEGKVKIIAEQNNHLKTLHADVAVIALPLGILKNNVVKFEPSLPEKNEAVQGLEFGNVIKIIFHFKERTWDDFGFIQSFDEPIPTWWSDSRSPILTGWAGGPKANALQKYSRSQVESLGFNILRKVLFPGASPQSLRRQLIASHYWNWADDPHIRGAYSYIPVNGLGLPKLLAAPIAETLFFAGEATVADAQTGTVFGALETGLRAAREILSSERPK